MKTFLAAGIRTFSFVVGHGGSQVSNHLFQRYAQLPIAVINNTEYSNRNLDWSAYLALSSRPGPVIYYEGDVIITPDVIRQLLADKGDICILVDPRPQSRMVDTRVIMDGRRPKKLLFSEHGNIVIESRFHSRPEFVCVVKFSDRARASLVAYLKKTSFFGPMRLYKLLSRLLAQFSSNAIYVDSPWIEIDNFTDLRRARKIIPKILENCSPHS